MPDRALDPVEWELVRADIAMEKARLKANGDWAKWEEFQSQTNIRWARMRLLPVGLRERSEGASSHDVRLEPMTRLDDGAPPRIQRQPGFLLRALLARRTQSPRPKILGHIGGGRRTDAGRTRV